jgi:hypothetical protein
MSACTHNNLLYGGPDYFAHGDQPCIHHTFTHAKSLATVLDSATPTQKAVISTGGGAAAVVEKSASLPLTPTPRQTLPRDKPYGLKSFPEIATHLASIGPWRATVTGYDFEYIERVQSGGAGASGGGHASGGALSLLYHQNLGPILTASMTEYQMIEISNQQVHLDKPHMPLTPRIESAGKQTYTSLSDFEAALTSAATPNQITFDARGRLLTASHQPLPNGEARYHLTYNLTKSTVEIIASVDAPSQTPLQFILPVISRSTETIAQPDPKTIRITKPNGTLTVRTNAPQGFDSIPKERTFNLVPGFEAMPLTIPMHPGQQIHIQLETP